MNEQHWLFNDFVASELKKINEKLSEMSGHSSRNIIHMTEDKGGIPRVYNFKVFNTEKVYYLHGFARRVLLHNAGPSDVVVSFPNSAGNFYTIPSGNDNANPLLIDNIANGQVDKLILRSNGVESLVEIVALIWPGTYDMSRGGD